MVTMSSMIWKFRAAAECRRTNGERSLYIR